MKLIRSSGKIASGPRSVSVSSFHEGRRRGYYPGAAAYTGTRQADRQTQTGHAHTYIHIHVHMQEDKICTDRHTPAPCSQAPFFFLFLISHRSIFTGLRGDWSGSLEGLFTLTV